MKPFFDYIKGFQFKNLFALLVCYRLLDLIDRNSALRDLMIVLLTLIVKHYFDSNTGAAAKDATISKALDQAQQLPAVGATTESGDITVKK